jgi:alpha-glucosidase
MRAFTSGNARLNSAYGFDFLYAERLTPELVAGVARNWPEDAGWPSWAFENHDAPRAVSRWSDGRNLEAFAHSKMLLLSALRGSIIIYQGEELGLPQVDVPFDQLRDPEAIANWPQTLSRDGARTPMPWSSSEPNLGFSDAQPWLPLGGSHRTLAVDHQEAVAESMLQFTRQCMELRERNPALRHGSMHVIEVGEEQLVFERSTNGQTLRCTFNLSDVPVERAMHSGRIVIGTGEISDSGLGPWSAVIEEVARSA